MADSRRLKRRNGVWYYRRRVPQDLIASLGRKVIQFSLDTTSLKEAGRRREIADLEWSAQFDAARRTDIAPAAPAVPKELPPATLRRLVIDYVSRTDQRFRGEAASDPATSLEELAEIIQEREIELQVLVDPGNPNGDQWVESGLRRLAKDAGFTLPNFGPELLQLQELVRRGFLEAERRRLAFYRDDHSRAFFDHLFDPKAPPEVTFGELAQERLRHVADEASANGHSRKWVDKQRACSTLVRELVGDDLPVRSVNYDICMKVRSTLARVPINRSKFYPGLSLEAAIERAQADGRSTLSSTSQQFYLSGLKDVLDLATRKGLITGNPAQGLGPLKRDTVSSSEKREPFTPAQLVALFNCAFYRRCAESGPLPYRYDKTGWRFWLPLICLFSGMRPNEVCQLMVGDIRCTKAGTWYFDISTTSGEGEEKKSLKTATSRRRVPIHPELVALGLLAFTKERRVAKAQRIFDTNPDKYGNLATYPLKRFRDDFLPRAIEVGARQSFYSFRHNFRDALRRIGAPPDSIQALGGWSQGKLVSDDYGDKSDPDYQVKFINGVVYPGLGLSHLYMIS